MRCTQDDPNRECTYWEKGHETIVEQRKPRSVLFIAAFCGHAEVVAALLTAGATANWARRGDGNTPLFMAGYLGHSRVVRLLLDAGADAEVTPTGTGETALYIASHRGCVEVVRELLAASGASLNRATTSTGATPLYAACQGGHLLWSSKCSS